MDRKVGEVNSPTPKPCHVFHLTHSALFVTVFGGHFITAAKSGSCDTEAVHRGPSGPQALEGLEGALLPSSAQEQAQRSSQEVFTEEIKVGGKGDPFPAPDLHIQMPIFLSPEATLIFPVPD